MFLFPVGMPDLAAPSNTDPQWVVSVSVGGACWMPAGARSFWMPYCSPPGSMPSAICLSSQLGCQIRLLTGLALLAERLLVKWLIPEWPRGARNWR